MNITLRTLTTSSQSELEQIAHLLSILRDKPVTINEISADIEQMIREDDRAIIVAENEDTIVGMIVLNVIVKINRREVKLDEFVVDPNARGEGVGSKLINASIEWTWEQNCELIELTSRPSREASNHLFQKAGFKLRETNVYQLKK